MSRTTLSLPAVLPTARSRRAAFLDACRDLRDRWQQARQRVADQRALAQLDAATLRDLGMSRGEFGSYQAERERLIEATRQRVLNELRAGARR